MSFRTKILGLVDVIMRVPPLFIIDEILKISMGLQGTSFESSQDNLDIDGMPISSNTGGDGSGGGPINSADMSLQKDVIEEIFDTFMEINNSLINATTEALQTAQIIDSESVDQDWDFIKLASFKILKFFICLLGE